MVSGAVLYDHLGVSKQVRSPNHLLMQAPCWLFSCRLTMHIALQAMNMAPAQSLASAAAWLRCQ